MTTVTLEQAIYGSSSGLADYRILGASAGVDENARTKITYYSSLGGSALATAFPPIFSFFRIRPGQSAFARTLYVGPTPRGSDYIVHAIIADDATLSACEFNPFVLVDARLFSAEKPSLKTILPPLRWNRSHNPANAVSSNAPPQMHPKAIATALRALAEGPLRFRVTEDDDAIAICRAVIDALPPRDRLKMTCCTRFSYRRALDFRLAAYIDVDAPLIQQQRTPGTVIMDFLGVRPASETDDYDRWVAEVSGTPEVNLVGPSVLGGVHEALTSIADVRRLRAWTTRVSHAIDPRELDDAAALVLRPENRERPLLRPLLGGALAVDLYARVKHAMAEEQPLVAATHRAAEITADIRSEAARWIREVSAAGFQAWIVGILLALPDASIEIIEEWLLRPDASLKQRSYLSVLSSRHPSACRSLLSIVLDNVRARFGAAGADLVVRIGLSLSNDRDALLDFIAVAEKAASEGPQAVRETWLTRIIRDVTRSTDLQAVAARLIVTYELLPQLADDEVVRVAPALFAIHEQIGPLLHHGSSSLFGALVRTACQRLRTGWVPQSHNGVEVFNQIILGACAEARRDANTKPDDLLSAVFLGSVLLPPATRRGIRHVVCVVIATLVERGMSDEAAALAVRALQSLARVGSIEISHAIVRALLRQARRHEPPSPPNAVRRYVRLRTLMEARPA